MLSSGGFSASGLQGLQNSIFQSNMQSDITTAIQAALEHIAKNLLSIAQGG
jgi:CRISPR/Cas system-associated endoribonuclease Cas2